MILRQYNILLKVTELLNSISSTVKGDNSNSNLDIYDKMLRGQLISSPDSDPGDALGSV
jgi:hypothetical protein